MLADALQCTALNLVTATSASGAAGGDLYHSFDAASVVWHASFKGIVCRDLDSSLSCCQLSSVCYQGAGIAQLLHNIQCMDISIIFFIAVLLINSVMLSGKKQQQ